MIGISSKIAYTIEIQTYIFWNLLAGVWEQIHLTMNELISGCEKGKGHLQMLGLPANTMWCRDDKCVRFPLSVGRSGMQLADIHKTLQWKKGKKKICTFTPVGHYYGGAHLPIECWSSAQQRFGKFVLVISSYIYISGETIQRGGRHLWNIQHLLPSRTTTGCFKFLID